MGKFFYAVPVIEDVDCEMVGGTHFDGLFQDAALLPTSSSNTLYPTPFVMPPSSYDSNYNPIAASEQFPSTSDILGLNKKTLDVVKNNTAEPVMLQTVRIQAPASLRISYINTTKDGKHLYVAMCPAPVVSTPQTPVPSTNSNQMEVDEESEIFSPKSLERMYWDHNCATPDILINGQTGNEIPATSAILLVYALDFSGKSTRIVPEPILRRQIPSEQAPIEHVFLPLQEKTGVAKAGDPTSGKIAQQPRGQVALVCKDGIVRLLELSSLKFLTEAKPAERNAKYISAAYCNSLERLCVCSSGGDLNFFCTSEEADSMEEKEDLDDVNDMITEVSGPGSSSVIETPGTSSSLAACHEPVLAYRLDLSYDDLRRLYELTRFDRCSPSYSATVPSCWSEMMQAQRQRHHPQHLHQSEDQHHTRTWRLQNDATTWDEHIFELTLPRTAVGCVGHVDVRFVLHWPCAELPTIQVTLLKQKITGLGHHKSPVDERIDFSLDSEQRGANPVVSEEYQRQHNTEILCGPMNLQRSFDLSENCGCVTLTSPKLLRTKAKTLLVHIKALIDPAKDGVSLLFVLFITYRYDRRFLSFDLFIIRGLAIK